MGAEVIKIERPVQGDDTRTWGPPFLKDAEGHETRDSSYFLSANRGKKSLTCDLSLPEGQELIRALARDADVVVENYKVGTLARYGLAYEDLRRINPRLVYCSVTGFGQDGPYAALPGYDFVFQGMGGLMSITGQPEGTPGDEPMKVGIAITDLLTGMYATTAILGALEHRHVSGVGQYIDMSLLDCVVTVNSYMAINYFLSGKMPRRMGNAHANMVPYQVFRCREGSLIVAVGNDSQYAAYCKAIDREHLATDPLYSTGPQRNRHRALHEQRISRRPPRGIPPAQPGQCRRIAPHRPVAPPAGKDRRVGRGQCRHGDSGADDDRTRRPEGAAHQGRCHGIACCHSAQTQSAQICKVRKKMLNR